MRSVILIAAVMSSVACGRAAPPPAVHAHEAHLVSYRDGRVVSDRPMSSADRRAELEAWIDGQHLDLFTREREEGFSRIVERAAFFGDHGPIVRIGDGRVVLSVWDDAAGRYDHFGRPLLAGEVVPGLRP